MAAICMYPDRLFIEDVVLNNKNEISGWVINGQWAYKEVDGVAYAMRQEHHEISQAVNCWSLQPRKIVVVRERYNYRDYNKVISTHERCEDESENLRNTLDALYVEEQNMKKKILSKYDDDIAF